MDAATAQQLFDRLDRLVGALEAMPRQTGALAVPVEAVAERTPVVDRTNELEARIDALERAVAMLRASGVSSFGPARSAPVPPTQMHALRQVRSQLTSTDEAAMEARRSVFGLSQQQVLERFGVPTRVEEEKEHTRLWRWSASDDTSLRVVFVDGLATSIY